MTKLLIPTRNRPSSLAGVLGFLEKFYPGTSVIVADGSNDQHKAAVAACTRQFAALAVDFRSYPHTVSLFDRILDVLKAERGDFIAMGADDDFPLMDVLQRAEDFLRSHKDYALAIGTLLVFDMDAPGELTARIRPVRPITHDQPNGRAMQFAAWPFPLSYSLCRRDVLIDRYEATRDCEMGELFDLAAGLNDCLKGKVHALPEISVVITRNFNHSYIRAKSKLEFFERGPEIAAMIRGFQHRLRQTSTLDADQALQLATRLFSRHIGTYLTGIPYHTQPEFINSNLHRQEFLCSQYAAFEKLFQPDTNEHMLYRDRLAYISQALLGNSSLDGKQDEQSFGHNDRRQGKS